MQKRIVIIGAGATGLGAAFRLYEKGHLNWSIYERCDRIGGLASSFTDKEGFTWDLGRHVISSQYPYFNRFVHLLLRDRLLERAQQARVYLLDKWVPYPFQNNIHHLPPPQVLECLLGLYKAQSTPNTSTNFSEWVTWLFGPGIANLFLLPYNSKIWGDQIDTLDRGWVTEKIGTASFERILRNIVLNMDDIGSGSCSTYQYPSSGGIGGLFQAIVPLIRKNLVLSAPLSSIDTESRTLHFENGAENTYDTMISTIPIDRLVSLIRPKRHTLIQSARMLHYRSIQTVGVGLEKPAVDTCGGWAYFPESDLPFYRVTSLPHISPAMVPEGDTARYSSFLCEIPCRQKAAEHAGPVTEQAVAGLERCGLIDGKDRQAIVSTWGTTVEYAYPVPSIDRDRALASLHPALARMGIFSRGRFGSWRYEIGDMDHSVMMGVEAVDRILEGSSEPTAGFRAGTTPVQA